MECPYCGSDQVVNEQLFWWCYGCNQHFDDHDIELERRVSIRLAELFPGGPPLDLDFEALYAQVESDMALESTEGNRG